MKRYRKKWAPMARSKAAAVNSRIDSPISTRLVPKEKTDAFRVHLIGKGFEGKDFDGTGPGGPAA